MIGIVCQSFLCYRYYGDKMNLKLIGTGSMYTHYNSACTLINDNLLVDMPNGTVKQLLKLDFDVTKIKTILVTHMHGDHIADIPFFIKYVFNYRKISNNLTIIGPKGIKKQIEQLFNAYRFEDEEEQQQLFQLEFIELFETSITIDDYKIESVEVVHGEEYPALGYVINQTLGFTGDSGICVGVEHIFKESSIVVADTSFEIGNNCHMGIDNLEVLNDKYHKIVIPTHINDKTRDLLKSKNLNFIQLHEDFDEIEIQ